MNTEKLIDKFVSKIENSELVFEKKDLSSRVENLESLLNKRFPSSFRYLISNYAFVPFEIEPIYFFGNSRTDIPEQLESPMFYDEFEPSKSDLSNAIFQDEFIYKTLSKNDLIQFARPSDESYDPICFDTRNKRSNHEYPIVRLDHEEILRNEKIKITRNISHSFYKFVLDFIQS